MKYSIYLGLGLLLLGITGCRKEEKGIKPQYRQVTEAIYSTVTVQPRNSYKIFSKIPGIIEYIYVKEGDTVKEGDLIVKLSDTKSGERIQNAQLQYEIAEEAYKGQSALLVEIENQIKNAEIKLYNDSINYARQKRLWDQNVGSRREFDQKKLAYDIARNDLSQLETMYHRKKKELSRQAQIAENTLSISKLDQRESNIYAKLSGMVYSLTKEVGESISAQSSIGVIGSERDFILSLLVDEVDIRNVYNSINVMCKNAYSLIVERDVLPACGRQGRAGG